MKVPSLVKYSKLSKSISGIINVLFWVVLGLAAASILAAIGIGAFPKAIDLITADNSFSISPDNIIRFEITASSISDTDISSLYSLLFISITLLLIMILFVLQQLKKILKNVVDAKPFAKENAKSIMYTGYIVIAGSVIVPVIKAFMVNKIVHAFDISNVNVVYTINTEILILGILLLLLSAIFNYGAYLQQEYDTTI